MAASQVAESVAGRKREALLDDGERRCRPCRLPDPGPARHLVRHHRRRVVGEGRQSHAAMIRAQDQRLRPAGEKGRAGVQRLVEVLVERRLVELGVDTEPRQRQNAQWGEGVGRPGADEPHSQAAAQARQAGAAGAQQHLGGGRPGGEALIGIGDPERPVDRLTGVAGGQAGTRELGRELNRRQLGRSGGALVGSDRGRMLARTEQSIALAARCRSVPGGRVDGGLTLLFRHGRCPAPVAGPPLLTTARRPAATIGPGAGTRAPAGPRRSNRPGRCS
jgi:hypothetical protein